jgi:APA family basic amino acid/polyamine antiporter
MSDSDRISRTVGLTDLLLLSVGGMIGSAVFYFPAFTGLWVGPASVLAWFLAGIGMLSVALCYTELSTAFPEQGGPAVFPAETFGHRPFIRRFFAYLEGVCYCLGWMFGVAISAWFVASYASRIPLLAVGGQTIPLALIAIVASFAVTVVGINVTTRANLVLTAFILAVLVVFVAMGLGNAESGNLTPFFTSGSLGFLEAVGVALTGYGAWTVIPSTAEEVKNPEKTLPRAIIGSLLIVTVLYTVVVFVFQAGVSPDAFERGTRIMYAPLSVVAEQTGSLLLARYALPLAALVAIFTTMLVGMTSAARVLWAMGRRGILPAVLATTHSRTETPWVSLLVIAVASCVLVLLRNLYGQVVLAALIGTVIPYAINILAFVGLRYYRPDVTPTFRAPGGYVLPVVAFVFLGGIMVGLGVDRPIVAGGVLSAILASFVVREAFAERGPVSRSLDMESDD